MPFKSVLDLLLDKIGSEEARSVLSRLAPDLTRERYVETILGFHKSVKIVTGEANGQLFNRDDLIKTLKRTLSNDRNTSFHFVFHKDDDKARAEADFQSENEELACLKRDFPKSVHFYWTPKRPRQHYAVIDEGERVILEQPRHTAREPFWATIILNRASGLDWENRFNEYVLHCEELEFESKPTS